MIQMILSMERCART